MRTAPVLGAALAGVSDDVVVATKVGYRFHERGRLAQLVHGAAGAAMRRIPGRSAGRVGASGAYAEQDFSPAYVRRAVAGSLRRLGRTHIDLLQFHGPPPATSCDLPVVVAELIDGGLIRAFGVGCEQLDVAASWVGVSGLACIQLAFGVLDPQAATDVLPAARAAGVGVIARGVLGGGLLAQFARGRPADLDPRRGAQVARLDALARANDVDLMQLAVWYGLHRAAVDAVLVGISSPGQLTANTALVDAPPPSDALLLTSGSSSSAADRAAPSPPGSWSVRGCR